eukprot:jgi/Mesvir1/19928/Mv13196-RA.1
MELLLEEYSLFDPLRSSQGEITVTRAGIEMTEEQLADIEIRFLRKLWHVLEKSNFRLISQEELDVAQAGHYLINLPITVDHDRIDKELLARYFERYPKFDRPAITDEFLIFRRGLGIDKATDFFFMQKVDSMLQAMFGRLLRTGKACLSSILKDRKQDPLLQVSSPRSAAGYGINGSDPGTPLSPGSLQRQFMFAGGAPGGMNEDENEDSNRRMKQSCTVERVRIENMKFSISNFFQMSTVQEPTFRNIVVIWRPAASKKPKKLNAVPTPAKRPPESSFTPGSGVKPSKGGRLGAVPEAAPPEEPPAAPPRETRRIEIRQFHDIPYSDMEIVLPEKKSPGLNHLDSAKLLVSAVTGIVAMIAGLKFDEDGSHLWLLLLFLAGLAAYVAKVYISFKAAKDLYHVQITNIMFSKQLNSGHTSLLHFANEMICQEVKEVLIAYFLLLRNGPCTADRLDEHCERFLAHRLGESTDFDVPDAIEKLTMLKLVTTGYDGTYTAVSTQEALGSSRDPESLREMESYVCSFMDCMRHGA